MESAPLRIVLTALTSAGIDYCLYSDRYWIEALPPGEELDLLVDRRDISHVDHILCHMGFRRTRVRRNPNHFFHMYRHGRQWLKLDVKAELWRSQDTYHIRGVLSRRRLVDGVWVATDDDLRARAERQLAQKTGTRPAVERVARGLFYYLPHTFRRRGAIVAVVGPDGAGKTTTIRELNRRIPMGIHNVYLGGFKNKSAPDISPGEPREQPSRDDAKAVVRQALPGAVVECLRTMKRGVILWQRLARAYAEAWRGAIVLCDRHPKEVLVHMHGQTGLAARLDHLVRVATVPWPDAAIILDAPGEALYARKGEHSPNVLETWRQRYRQVFMPHRGHAISTEESLESTIDEALDVIWHVVSERSLRQSQHGGARIRSL